MSTNEDGAVLVLTTTADDKSARALSLSLVEEGLAACVSRSAVRSVFRWQSSSGPDVAGRDARVCEEDEVMLVIKTASSRADEVEKRLKELHPYECPEIVYVLPARVEERYLAWLLGASAVRNDGTGM